MFGQILLLIGFIALVATVARGLYEQFRLQYAAPSGWCYAGMAVAVFGIIGSLIF